MALPSIGKSMESQFPLVQQQGLNTRKASNLAGTTIDTSGNIVGAGTITATGGSAPAGGFSSSDRCFSTGGRGYTSLTAGHSTAFVTTDTYIAEIFIPANVTVTGVSVLMGTTAGNGNLTVGLANSAGTVVANSATTTTSGTSTTYTQVSFTATYAAVGPATYYVLVQGSSTSDFLGTHVAGNFGASLQTSQTYGTLTNITAPTTFTANQGPIADLF